MHLWRFIPHYELTSDEQFIKQIFLFDLANWIFILINRNVWSFHRVTTKMISHLRLHVVLLSRILSQKTMLFKEKFYQSHHKRIRKIAIHVMFFLCEIFDQWGLFSFEFEPIMIQIIIYYIKVLFDRLKSCDHI